MSKAVILGSAWKTPTLGGVELEPRQIPTPFGPAVLHRYPGLSGAHEDPKRGAWVLFRHGAPHCFLPQQIPYRAHAAALEMVGCKALLVTSSVGVLDAEIPLDEPLIVRDLMMLDNRLPDGSACTLFQEPTAGQGHLVLEEGLFSRGLSAQVAKRLRDLGLASHPPVVFAYSGGPRSKTAAENRMWATLGAQINSMTLAPEVVLANEAQIPTAAVCVGHKHSVENPNQRVSHQEIDEALCIGGETLERVSLDFLKHIQPVPFKNRFYRYDEDPCIETRQ